MPGRLESSGALKSRIVPPWQREMASALAVSIGLPPPNPMTRIGVMGAHRFETAISDSVVGSGTVRRRQRCGSGFPAAVMIGQAAAVPVAGMNASVTSSGR